MIIILRKSSVYLIAGIIVMGILVSRTYLTPTLKVFGLPVGSKVVVIDPGHGGVDPGKIGSSSTSKVEKQINLEISLKLQGLLEQSGAAVVMTRVDDSDLSGENNGGHNKKNRDLRARRLITNGSQSDILVSIHQNSYPSSSVRGAQVFYHGHSNEAKLLAKCIQDRIVQYVDTNNHRKAKENSSYAMLKNTSIPAVIVECGFLSNPEEELLLNSAAYQQKLAESIYSGIKLYFEELSEVQKGEKTFQSLLPEDYFKPSNTP